MSEKSKVVGESTTTTAFSYDALDRTESIGNNTFAYDCDGNRIAKNTTETVWDNDEVSADLTGNDIKVFTEDNSVYCENGVFTFNAIDCKGDVLASTSSYYGDYTYDAYGNDLYNTNTTNPIGYRGYYFDSETGLYYLKARYYDSTTGQFTQEDTVQDDNLQYNLYGYCSANPVLYVDFDGHKKKKYKYKGITINYNGTAADLRNFENGKAPIDYTFLKKQSGKSFKINNIRICTDGSTGDEVEDSDHRIDTAFCKSKYKGKKRYESYLNAYETPYIVLPGSGSNKNVANLGDLAILLNRTTKKYVWCIVGERAGTDISKMGEVSIAAIWKTGNPNHKTANNNKGLSKKYIIIVYKGISYKSRVVLEWSKWHRIKN